MKLKGKITILVNREYTDIEIEDADSHITFVKARLTPEQFSSAMARIAFTDCELSINRLDNVGKKHENERFEFPIPAGWSKDYKKDNDATLAKYGQSILDIERPNEGWVIEGYFGSQNSFLEKDGKKYARCTIRRWI